MAEHKHSHFTDLQLTKHLQFAERLVSWFLDFNVPSTAYGHLKTDHTFKIILHQFKTQVNKP